MSNEKELIEALTKMHDVEFATKFGNTVDALTKHSTITPSRQVIFERLATKYGYKILDIIATSRSDPDDINLYQTIRMYYVGNDNTKYISSAKCFHCGDNINYQTTIERGTQVETAIFECVGCGARYSLSEVG